MQIRSLLVALATCSLVATSIGCVAEDEVDESGDGDGLPDEVTDQDDSIAASGEEEEVPYSCQAYGDCIYCEDRWGDFGGCTEVDYSWYCSSGDVGHGNYYDCSWIGF